MNTAGLSAFSDTSKPLTYSINFEIKMWLVELLQIYGCLVQWLDWLIYSSFYSFNKHLLNHSCNWYCPSSMFPCIFRKLNGRNGYELVIWSMTEIGYVGSNLKEIFNLNGLISSWKKYPPLILGLLISHLKKICYYAFLLWYQAAVKEVLHQVFWE